MTDRTDRDHPAFYWRQTLAPAASGGSCIEVGFTGRSPGIGTAPWDGFNLGGGVGDDPRQVAANRVALAGCLGVDREQLVFMNQVHGATVLEVSGPWGGPVTGADAVVTRSAGLALAVLVADCVPVLLHDAAAGVIGAVHAGRPGMTAEIVPRAVAEMRRLGGRQLSAVVGPSVCGRCYEVPAEMAEHAAGVAPSSRARSWTGTPAIDVASGVVEQLARDDVAVEWVPGCTREDPDLYSYRRDGRTGRLAGVILRRADTCG